MRDTSHFYTPWKLQKTRGANFPLRRNSVCVFAYTFIADGNFLNKFCSSHPNFNRNILTSLHFKSEISAHAQLRNYSFIHSIYKFYGMVSVENLHWVYLLINGVYRYRYEHCHATFPRIILLYNFLLEISTFTTAIKLTFGWNRFGKKTEYNLQTRTHFYKKSRDQVDKIID